MRQPPLSIGVLHLFRLQSAAAGLALAGVSTSSYLPYLACSTRMLPESPLVPAMNHPPDMRPQPNTITAHASAEVIETFAFWVQLNASSFFTGIYVHSPLLLHQQICYSFNADLLFYFFKILFRSQSLLSLDFFDYLVGFIW